LDIQEYIKSGAIESYVMGLADEGDVAELERLKEMYPEVAKAVAASEEWWEKLAFSQAVPVSDKIREQTLASLGNTRTIPSAKGRNFLPYLAAASLILLIASLGLNFYLYQQVDQLGQQVSLLGHQVSKISADYKFVADPSILKVVLSGVPGKEGNTATVFWDTQTKDVYISQGHLPQAPEGKQYQLWALVDGKPVDAGLLADCGGICHLKNIPRAQAFAITLENAGGSPVPTLSQLFVMGNVKS
jgi:anti-sigma-K factor RskA